MGAFTHLHTLCRNLHTDFKRRVMLMCNVSVSPGCTLCTHSNHWTPPGSRIRVRGDLGDRGDAGCLCASASSPHIRPDTERRMRLSVYRTLVSLILECPSLGWMEEAMRSGALCAHDIWGGCNVGASGTGGCAADTCHVHIHGQTTYSQKGNLLCLR